MNQNLSIELYGYLGSVLVVVSMLMTSVVKLRVINALGSIISGTYGLIIGSFPLALMNACLLTINIYNLVKLLKTDQQYELMVGSSTDAFVRYFLDRNLEDIRGYFPDFSGMTQQTDAVYMVCCSGCPAGILLGRKKENGAVDVQLDYTVPAYRDCSVGSYLYARLAAQGIETLTFSHKASDDHVGYMKKMGFKNLQGTYTKELK